jgi:hypothetical protein
MPAEWPAAGMRAGVHRRPPAATISPRGRPEHDHVSGIPPDQEVVGMIAICPSWVVPFVSSRHIKLKDLIQIVKANGKNPTKKIPEKISSFNRKEYDHRYYLANKERKNAFQWEYDAAHREHIKEYHHQRYLRKKMGVPA